MRIICLLVLGISLNTFGQLSFEDDASFQKFLKKQLKLSSKKKHFNFEENLSPEACIADLSILKYILEEAQTTLYRYASKAQIDNVFKDAFKACQKPQSYLEMVRHIAKIEHTIACGHSSWGHHPDYFDYRNKHIKLFPFEIMKRDWGCLLYQNNSMIDSIPTEVGLKEINGEKIDSVLIRLKQYMGRDGTSMDRSLDPQAKYFANAYSNFIGEIDTFHLMLRDVYGDTSYFSVPALYKHQIDSIRRIRYPNWKKHGLPLQLDIENELSTAIYRIEWFRKDYIKSKGQDFESFTDSVFQVINDQNIENLVIDLRANTGGWTAYGKYLFSYFIDQPTPYLSNVVCKKYKDYSFEKIIINEPGYLDTFQMELNSDGLYEWANYPNAIANPQDENRFGGQVYILTDNFTRSCSGMFSSLMREHSNAIFVGKETGATSCGAGGMVCTIQLPHTGIMIHFSTGKYVTEISDSSNSRGVIPDVEYDGDWENVYSKEWILKYIRKQQK